jgi:general secretion pathway protein D
MLKRVIFIFLLCFSLPLLAETAPQTQPPADDSLTINMKDADILAFVQWASQYTKKHIIVDPRVKGSITVISNAPVKKEEAFQIFLSVLEVHGFTAIETEDSIKILPSAEAKESEVPLSNEKNPGKGDEMVVRIIKIKNISAQQLVTFLRPLIPQVGYLAAYPESNSLLITDRAANVERIIQIIQSIDNTGSINIEVVPLKFASAKEIITVLNSLLPKPAGAAPGAADGNSAIISFVADERSNSILLSGDAGKRKEIRSLIQRLDYRVEGAGNTQVFYLHYAKAEDLVPVLQSLSGSIQKDEKGNQTVQNSSINIQATPHTNALVITAPPSIMENIKHVISKLDIRRNQVFVEAIIVEVSESGAKDFGIGWRTNEPGSDGVFGGFTAGIKSNFLEKDPTTGKRTLTSGVNLGWYRNGTLRGLLQALLTDRESNVLSTPTLVTLDNEEAEILVGQNVPFITGEQSSQNGNDNPFTTIQRQDIGVKLKIKPQINSQDSITLDIEQEVSNVNKKTDGVDAADIITNKRNIKTRVLIDDDKILVLGGLISSGIENNESAVPYLSNIPFIGWLFKSSNKTREKTNLMVFIHPVILKDERTASKISSDQYDSIRDKQLSYGKDSKDIITKYPPDILPELEKLMKSGKTVGSTTGIYQ